MDRGQASAEMVKVLRALESTQVMLAGHDQADAARALRDQPQYSPLRTLVEQAVRAAGGVLEYLRE